MYKCLGCNTINPKLDKVDQQNSSSNKAHDIYQINTISPKISSLPSICENCKKENVQLINSIFIAANIISSDVINLGPSKRYSTSYSKPVRSSIMLCKDCNNKRKILIENKVKERKLGNKIWLEDQYNYYQLLGKRPYVIIKDEMKDELYDYISEKTVDIIIEYKGAWFTTEAAVQFYVDGILELICSDKGCSVNLKTIEGLHKLQLLCGSATNDIDIVMENNKKYKIEFKSNRFPGSFSSSCKIIE